MLREENIRRLVHRWRETTQALLAAADNQPSDVLKAVLVERAITRREDAEQLEHMMRLDDARYSSASER